MAAATVIRDHCLAPGRVDAPIAEGGRYGRMFDLRPFDADETLLHQLGAAGGFAPIGEHRVDWSLFFDVPGRPAAQRSKPMDGLLPRSLIELPQAITGAVDEEAYRSPAARDLERGQGTGLPSGEAVAHSMGAEPLSEDELDLRRHGWEGETPLWLYILRESSARHSGERLGEVAGGIVADVLCGVILRDPESYLAIDPDWAPTLPARSVPFGLADILVPVEAPARAAAPAG